MEIPTRRVALKVPSNPNFQGLIDGHLCRISSAFPSAIFLLEYRDQVDCAWKEVMRNGVVER